MTEKEQTPPEGAEVTAGGAQQAAIGFTQLPPPADAIPAPFVNQLNVVISPQVTRIAFLESAQWSNGLAYPRVAVTIATEFLPEMLRVISEVYDKHKQKNETEADASDGQ